MRYISIFFPIVVLVEAEIIPGYPIRGAALHILAGPSNFSYPPNCSKTAKPKDVPYCATGELDVGVKSAINFNTYLFDVKDPTETVLFGLNVTIDKGIPESFEVLTGGHAAPGLVDLLPKLMPRVVEIAPITYTSGGGAGKYDPETKSYSAEFNISFRAGVYIFGQKVVVGQPLNGVGKAWAKPHNDIGLTGIVTNSAGDSEPKLIFNLTNSITTVNGSILTWHVYSGMSMKMNTSGRGQDYTDKTFVNKIIQLTPPK
ncbi:hypothetical protein Pmar_PMAR003620 [Perkinsus marinus ATCC 50983]|uniref:Uncharacterized protein n=1 Tax=Perkinsus marinus (strain ATCC 50983 / TXsc) TaxID=423536 RepID=C5KHU5_PERM5|nr:hypothetical protein Pmar_PMAR003620 [Perkinsus marinus ATCC 50983]EER16157.1 hypothetical protein Pmar_PMAR003620 [Perkinsus marinus ATCC 50983]|eukprot:XP_002784361.1 hypothetical protein Pmar_PMAR003620 [Perkinsus marinus ATCC 50983]